MYVVNYANESFIMGEHDYFLKCQCISCLYKLINYTNRNSIIAAIGITL